MRKNNYLLILSLTLSLLLSNCSANNNKETIEQSKQRATKLLSITKDLVEQNKQAKDSKLPKLIVNEEHKFEITPCQFKYNGKEFRLGGKITDLIKVFGPYNRYIDRAVAYVWDDFGFSVLCNMHTEEPTEFRICFDCCEWIDPNDMEGTLPKSCFKGAILIDGIPFGQGILIEQFKSLLKEKKSDVRFGTKSNRNNYEYRYNCDYDGELIYYEQENHLLTIREKKDAKYFMLVISDSRPAHKLQMQYDKEQAEKEKHDE